ncbi:hypothetical protein TWF569_000542 [Orbilia oligospora]|uniref:BTB domain-containing protein n=1 Tax=Orbilia oligospora TaxID=2813651 RepID=A0A7C8JTR2_ORBOL|nr:hypothetical protein TWF706_004217 [Orbilia oligospora]KAF3105077.1 hypothetical protein TWF706_004217 [Orbilia oligospora]KAF3112879.1 hypothetical protein TWF102_004270 [Orbilia oligospora]KAF3117804.1 hypothetical protein TWF103_004478 [Orbilia oligospora]KAF3126466.1 hypothetical protein TWF569_000542 [Orbilia oligospora]
MDLSEVLKSPTIALKVGPLDSEDVATYHVHESVLIKSSHYFKQVLNSKFSETVKREIALSSPVDTPQACELFFDFAYKGKCEPKTSNPLLSYGEAYLFGEKIQAIGFKEYIYTQARAEADQKFRDLDFLFNSIKPTDAFSKPRAELLDTWGLLIEMIYEDTYDNKEEVLSAATPSDAGTPFKDHLDNVKSWLETSKLDSFRGLLSQISAQYPLVIASNPRIVKLIRSIPGFAADILNYQLKSAVEEVEQKHVFALPHLYAVTRKKSP